MSPTLRRPQRHALEVKERVLPPRTKTQNSAPCWFWVSVCLITHGPKLNTGALAPGPTNSAPYCFSKFAVNADGACGCNLRSRWLSLTLSHTLRRSQRNGLEVKERILPPRTKLKFRRRLVFWVSVRFIIHPPQNSKSRGSSRLPGRSLRRRGCGGPPWRNTSQ